MGMTGQPVIPEEGLLAWQTSSQQQSCAAEAQQQARKMPTLLEQLQLFERQRQGSGSMPLLNVPPSIAMARNTSFERCECLLPSHSLPMTNPAVMGFTGAAGMWVFWPVCLDPSS